MPTRRKVLTSTTDFHDNLIKAGKPYKPENIEELLLYLASIGVKRVKWIWDTWWSLYKQPFGNKKNVLEYVADKAHSLGMEVHAEIKPFETGLYVSLPHTFPRPEGIPYIDDPIRGILCMVDPFNVAHPHMQLKRKPGNWDCTGKVSKIKIVKDDTEPIHIGSENLQIWTGEKNGSLMRYAGTFSVSESVEWKRRFPYAKQCRVLRISGLDINEKQRFIGVRCLPSANNGEFKNTVNELVEIYDEDNNLLPSTPATGKIKGQKNRIDSFPYNTCIEYARAEEVQEFLKDPDREQICFKDFYEYGINHRNPVVDFGRQGAGVARGRREYLQGLNPIYPKVQQYWLGIVRDCINSNVDGINFRVSNHSCYSDERDEYGFNEPVLKKCNGKIDRDTVSRINANAYNQFLQKASAMLKKNGLYTTVQIEATWIHPDAREKDNPRNSPPNFYWDWEKWIKEYADIVYIKGQHHLIQPHEEHCIDMISRVAKEHGKPVFYRSTNKEVRFSGNHYRVEYEIQKVIEHDRLDGYDLYETANFTRLNNKGKIEGSPEIAKLTKELV